MTGDRGSRTRGSGNQNTGSGKAEHGDREGRTRGSGTERRSFIACRSLVRKRWITRLHEAGPQATDSLYHNSDSHPVSGRSQLLLAKQKMATWGAPIRWPTPVGEARDRDLAIQWGSGKAEHGDRVQKGGRSSLVVPWFASVGSRDCTKLDRRPQIPCITILTHTPYLVGANSCWRSKRWRRGVCRSDGIGNGYRESKTRDRVRRY